jgi:hypothetical protein
VHSSAAALLDGLLSILRDLNISPTPFSLDSLSMGLDASLELIVRPQRLVETYNVPVFRPQSRFQDAYVGE